MKRPNKLALGAHEWEIRYEPVPEEILKEYDIEDPTTGLFFDPEGVIYIEPSYCNQRMKVSLLHEIVRAIDLCYNTQLIQEGKVEAMAHALFNLLNQNVELVTWILTERRDENGSF
jgi:hypothetical protein